MYSQLRIVNFLKAVMIQGVVSSDVFLDLKIDEMDELLQAVGFTIEPAGKIIKSTPGTVCAYYVRPKSGSWEFCNKKFFYSQSTLNTWGDATRMLKENLRNKKEVFEEFGIKKTLYFDFANGKFLPHLK